MTKLSLATRHRGRVAIAAALFAIPGLINLYPLVGVLGAKQLESLYGVDVAAPDLALLLRHRAVLFGLLGALLLAATWRPRLRALATGAGLVSMLAFVVLALPLGAHGPAVVRVAWADLLASLLLACGALLARQARAP